MYNLHWPLCWLTFKFRLLCRSLAVDAADTCSLICQSKRDTKPYKFRNHVRDGTRCSPMTESRCVKGKCLVCHSIYTEETTLVCCPLLTCAYIHSLFLFCVVFFSSFFFLFVLCQDLGCNGLLNTTKKIDVCGVCGGNNASCSLISDSALVSTPYRKGQWNHQPAVGEW